LAENVGVACGCVITALRIVGLSLKTKDPVPVSSVTAVLRFADEGVAKNVSTPVPKPVTFEIETEPVA
jgi:hypothetical protein